MFLLVAVVAAAALAWLAARGLWVRTGLPLGKIVYADVGTAFPVTGALKSQRYGLVGKPDYLVRLKDGIAAVEVKSGRAPASGRPHQGHLFQLAAYCLLVEDVSGIHVPYGLVKYDDRSLHIDFTSELRTDLLVLLDEMRAAKQASELHINHNQPGKCRSCGFRTVCGESLI
jgi:CRISPR-associated exonuclease Cas4